MTKPETPLQLLSTVVNCLTAVIEDETVEPCVRQRCEPIRDAAINVALDIQTIAGEVSPGAVRFERESCSWVNDGLDEIRVRVEG